MGDTPTRLPILPGSSSLYLPMWRLWSFAVGLVVEMKQAEKMPLIPQGGDNFTLWKAAWQPDHEWQNELILRSPAAL